MNAPLRVPTRMATSSLRLRELDAGFLLPPVLAREPLVFCIAAPRLRLRLSKETNIGPCPGITPDGYPDRCRSTTPCGFVWSIQPMIGGIKSNARRRSAGTFVGRGGEGGI